MSVPFSAKDVADWTGGTLLQGSGDVQLTGASIDSRAVAAGDLFVAIVGPNHDAHAYLATAAESGAAGFLVARDREIPAVDLPVVAVDDTTAGLGRLAAEHRAHFDGPVVGITGSNGKTTAKEMCAAILETGARTLRNRGNLNNHFGLPLTLLARGPEHRRIVVELGMNHRGEIAELAAIARPQIGAVTNVGTAHIEYLGSREAIASEKGDLLASLPHDGVAVINADDPFADALAQRTEARIVRFGRGDTADVRPADVCHEEGRFRFRLQTPAGETSLEVTGLDETTLVNALCAAAAASAAGASLDEIAAGLAAYRPVSGRLERRNLPDRVVIIDDSYNANPQSMEVALGVLARSGNGRRIAVLGDMGELGESAESAHRDAGRLSAQLGIDFLVAVGNHAHLVAEGARQAGFSAGQIHELPNSQAAGQTVRSLLEPGAWILVKGSRSMRMERVTRYLEAEAEAR
ncbi:MAG: UDP-N-acetylmuramoyl-tripeptide--D-alanyl-D-alanine ligase [Myxococcota bacterium]|nr:UDP-N-acetylmuramoyl-tripeptide--D-alanyl-D-alanine ligase [Myxococcota bacterium]